MIQIKRYTSQDKPEWNRFNQQAVNGSFLFDRNFMEYHKDRFEDHSLLFYSKGKLMALLPLHQKADSVASHLGLSFGGVIISEKVHTVFMLQLFEQLLVYLRNNLFKIFIYKPQPFIYSAKPAQDDLFALYQFQARLHSRTILSVLDLANPISYSKLRKRCLKKALANNIEVKYSDNLPEYMQLVQIIYDAANLKPTHTPEELQLLKENFPEQIKLLVAYLHDELLGGVIIFEHNQVVNLQYMATSPKGKQLHALDLVIYIIINKYQDQKKYVNFGTSQDNGPYGLNLNLLQNKISYGTHAVVQDTYQIPL